MIRRLVAALLVLLTTELCVHANDVDLFRDKVYVVSSYAFKGNVDQFPKTKEGLVDLRQYLEARDIKLPATGLAIYDPGYATVNVRAPAEVIERLDELWRADYPIAARISFILVEFSLDESVVPLGMPYEELKKAAGSSWRILDRLTVVAKSGYKVASDLQGKRSASKVVAPVKQKDAGSALWPNPSGTFGSKVEVEVLIGDSVAEMDVTFAYQYHSRAAGETPEVAMNVNANATLLHNVPVIVHTVTVNPPRSDQARTPGKEYAVVAHAIVEDALGRSLSPKKIGPSSPSEYASPMRLLPGNVIGPFPTDPKPKR